MTPDGILRNLEQIQSTINIDMVKELFHRPEDVLLNHAIVSSKPNPPTLTW